MKRIVIFSLVAMIGFGFALSAQDQRRGPNTQRMSQMTPEKRAEQLAESLDLSDAQKSELAALFTEQQAIWEKRRSEFSTTQDREVMQQNRENMRKEREAYQKEQNEKMEQIIGKEKMEQLKKIQEERRNENRNRPTAGRRMNQPR